jgi:hypothetical protein
VALSFRPFGSSDDCPAGGDSSPLLHSDDLTPLGIASTKQQIEWVANRPKPNRCVFSKAARRIVPHLRPFCAWAREAKSQIFPPLQFLGLFVAEYIHFL